ncbi:hypothetical protein AAFF_G00075800 [Aldrovandia affinis]|uniref:Uncharacterized protein n=1 Tax=Aldrovandia affinis TaxID=143900 RepID=A0AAD7RY49_9TELE|nr:hypothetical protein AAFF_G00075800 [Aldrovandia affinis]
MRTGGFCLDLTEDEDGFSFSRRPHCHLQVMRVRSMWWTATASSRTWGGWGAGACAGMGWKPALEGGQKPLEQRSNLIEEEPCSQGLTGTGCIVGSWVFFGLARPLTSSVMVHLAEPAGWTPVPDLLLSPLLLRISGGD